LWKTATCRRPKDDGQHDESGFQFSAGVAIDFATKRDLDNYGLLPGHAISPGFMSL
jgi:hypothetical protein